MVTSMLRMTNSSSLHFYLCGAKQKDESQYWNWKFFFPFSYFVEFHPLCRCPFWTLSVREPESFVSNQTHTRTHVVLVTLFSTIVNVDGSDGESCCCFLLLLLRLQQRSV